MTPASIIFLITAIVTLGAAFMVVTARNLVHSALWLVLSLFGVAVVFVLLYASFLAVAQVVVYIGAIAILVIFALMLTRRTAVDSSSQANPNWAWAAVIAVVIFAGLAWMLTTWQGGANPPPPISADTDLVTRLGTALVSPDLYVLPFEVASVLLLAALIGSIMIAWDRKSG